MSMQGACLLSPVLHNGNEILFSQLAKQVTFFRFRDFFYPVLFLRPFPYFAKHDS